jgi:hypothetical protein
MEIPHELLSDPRFLAAVRSLLQARETKTPPPGEESSSDEVTRRVRLKILLRMKQRQPKR